MYWGKLNNKVASYLSNGVLYRFIESCHYSKIMPFVADINNLNGNGYTLICAKCKFRHAASLNSGIMKTKKQLYQLLRETREKKHYS